MVSTVHGNLRKNKRKLVKLVVYVLAVTKFLVYDWVAAVGDVSKT